MIVADLANAALRCNTPTLPQRLDDMAETIVREEPTTPHPELIGLKRNLYIRWSNTKPSAYVEFFVHDLLGLDQGPPHQKRGVQRSLFHALDKVLWPCDSGDLDKRKDVLLLKRLRAGDCKWSTCQVLLW